MLETRASTTSEAAELDLTNAHLATLEDVPLRSTLTTLDLTANRLKTIDQRLVQLPDLKSLLFRQNLLTDVSDIAKLASASGVAANIWSKQAQAMFYTVFNIKDTNIPPLFFPLAGLQELVLYDNNISQLPNLAKLTSLQKLDLSHNQLRNTSMLVSLPAVHLQELYLTSNKMSAIQDLAKMTALTLLELGDNRLQQLEGLAELSSLAELWLGRNRIASISGLDRLTSLRRLSIQSNRLTSMTGLESCTSLQELYLSHNGITQIEGISDLQQLQILDVSNNQLTTLSGVSTLKALQDVWLNDNQIADLENVNAELNASRSTITCIYLANNLGIRNHAAYKRLFLQWFPKLQQLDADYVRRDS